MLNLYIKSLAHQKPVFSLLSNFQGQIFPLLTTAVSNINDQCFMPVVIFHVTGILDVKN